MSFPKKLTSLAWLGVGCSLILFAAAFSNGDYARFLLGENAKNLSWGPTLFRALLLFHGLLLVSVGVFWKNLGEKRERVSPVDEASESPTFPVFAALSALSAGALILRFFNLNSDLWVDEVYTLLDFVRQPIGEILTSFPSQNQHMLYSILAHASISAFGETAWALRLPSVLFGTASIWALFFLARSLFDTRTAFLACLLMTVSYHHIWFSQNARGYMGLLFFTLLATWFWFEALRKNQWRWWLAYAAAVVLGMWIHMTMAFLVAVHGLVYLAFVFFPKLSGDDCPFSLERRAGIRPFAAWLLSVSVTLQLYALALPQFLREGLHEESGNSEWTNPLWVVTEILQNLSIGFAGIAAVLGGGLIVAFGCWRLWKQNRRMSLWMILPPVLAGAFMLALGHNLFPRFFFFAMGFGLLIVVRGAAELPAFVAGFFENFQKNKIRHSESEIPNPIGFAVVVLMILVSAVTVPRNYALPKQDFSGAKNYVENNRSPDERIVAVTIAGEMYNRYFAPQWAKAETNADLENLQRSDEKIWLIYTLPPEIKAFQPQLWREIEKNYEVVRIFPGTLNGGEIFVCRKRQIKENRDETSRNIGQN
jgi:4-amino-4-deoxy-L-arabinose transferase-like glycosyltransferase